VSGVVDLQASAGPVSNSLTFEQLLDRLSTRLHSSVIKNLSVPIAFVCLLHLANDKVCFISDHCMVLGYYSSTHTIDGTRYCIQPQSKAYLYNVHLNADMKLDLTIFWFFSLTV